MAVKAKEIFKLYAVKHGAIKEYFADYKTADSKAVPFNVKVTEVKFMKRPDNSVYAMNTVLDEEPVK